MVGIFGLSCSFSSFIDTQRTFLVKTSDQSVLLGITNMADLNLLITFYSGRKWKTQQYLIFILHTVLILKYILPFNHYLNFLYMRVL